MYKILVTLFIFVLILSSPQQVDIYFPVVHSNPLITPTSITFPTGITLPIVKQPIDNPEWVSLKDNEVTLFNLATSYGSIGLLAHNNLAGRHFLLGYNEIIVLKDSKNTKSYIVIDIQEYQAVEPLNPYTDFYDLYTGDRLTVEQVFMRTYGVKDRLVLQTSINRYNVIAWGRLFIIAISADILIIPVYKDNTLLKGNYLVY